MDAELAQALERIERSLLRVEQRLGEASLSNLALRNQLGPIVSGMSLERQTARKALEAIRAQLDQVLAQLPNGGTT